MSFDDAKRSTRARSNAAVRQGSARDSRNSRSSRSSRSSRGGYEGSASGRGVAERSERGVADRASSRSSRSRLSAYDGFDTQSSAFDARSTRTSRTSRKERSRDFSYDDEFARSTSTRGVSTSAKASKKDKAKRARVKERADKQFARMYGGDTSGSQAEPAGPRAAVYKGEMGTQHKKAARMQDSAPSSRGSSQTRAKKERSLSPKLIVPAAIAACLLFSCVILYAPAQLCYQEIRERDRLQAEYTAIQQRNEAIQSEVDALSTKAGIEDRAHEEFGWVKEGENAASVAGLDIEEESNFRANIVPGSIEAPDTWYSGVLDPLFGVE